jgi:hypothetical protein
MKTTKKASRRFEARFAGPANKGLRARIRRMSREDISTPEMARRVLALAHTIAFTAQGLHTLCEVAHDYDPAGRKRYVSEL